jgi:L-fucono-1,5-lactonase
MQSAAVGAGLVAAGALSCDSRARAVRIDTHQHYWTYGAASYSWIPPGSAVARDFGPAELAPLLARSDVDATLVVEARAHIAETEDLLRIARQTAFVRGVVGWLPLSDPEVQGLIERHASDPKLRGLRHAILAEPDPDFMSRADFNRGVAALQGHGLRYDLLLSPRELGRAPAFVDRHPKQIFILDHLAKPPIRARQLEPWRSQLRELALRPNVYCKLSGLVNEADLRHWQPGDLRPYLDSALELFGARRLMFGSDWPMCLLGTTYARWVHVLGAWLAPLSQPERDRIWGGTAVEAYGLS